MSAPFPGRSVGSGVSPLSVRQSHTFMPHQALISILAVGLVLGCSSSRIFEKDQNRTNSTVQSLRIADLLARRELYQGKCVQVVGYYVGTFEHTALHELKSELSSETALWVDQFHLAPNYKSNIPQGLGNYCGMVCIMGTCDFGSPLVGAGYRARITNLELFESISAPK